MISSGRSPGDGCIGGRPRGSWPGRCRRSMRWRRWRGCRSGLSVSRPRTVWVTGVKGWYSAKWRSPAGHGGGGDESAAEEGQQGEEHGRVAGGLDALGGQAECGGSQIRATAKSRTSPAAASHGEGAGGGPETDARATATTRRARQGLQQAADDVAGEHGARAMDMVRKRSMMPWVMSVATEMAVPRAAEATVMIRMPGTT